MRWLREALQQQQYLQQLQQLQQVTTFCSGVVCVVGVVILLYNSAATSVKKGLHTAKTKAAIARELHAYSKRIANIGEMVSIAAGDMRKLQGELRKRARLVELHVIGNYISCFGA
jgi:hypothetical protein